MFGKYSNIGNLLSLFYSNFFSDDSDSYLNIEQKKINRFSFRKSVDAIIKTNLF